MRAWIILLPMTALAAACYLFSDDNRPCSARGECLPGYTCVAGLCVPADAVPVGGACRETGECEGDAVCADIYCYDRSSQACEVPDDCGGLGALQYECRDGHCACATVCRPACTYPDNSSCGDGLLCWRDPDQELDFCQEGHCGGEGTYSSGACLDTEVCLELNGIGSGLCTPLCTILAQNIECQQAPVPDGVMCCGADDNCEHYANLWGTAINPHHDLGLCLPGGDREETASCSNDPKDNAFCAPGLFCNQGRCSKYCLLAGGNPACGAGYSCIPFTQEIPLPYGWCRPLS